VIGSGRPRHLLLLVALVLGSACRFEKRPDLAASEPVDSVLSPPAGGSGGLVEDSVRATIAAVSGAFGMGDVTRVAQLTTPDAVLIDQEDEVRWTRLDAAAELPRPLSGGNDGLSWELDGSTFSLLSDDSALVSVRYHATVSGEGVPWTAVESWVLVRDAGGWRLRYLHRSRGLGRTVP
jgi:ketosteroid isomerase-like protein